MSARARTGVVAAIMLALFALGAAVFLMPFAFPTPPPIITRFSATHSFTPGAEQGRTTARVSVRVRQPSRVSVIVRDDSGAPVRGLMVDRQLPVGWFTVSWQGRDDTGRLLPPGSYTIDLNARSGKKRFNKSRRIVIEPAPAPVTAPTPAPAPSPPPAARTSP